MVDFATLLGIEPGQLEITETERNISPSKDVIDILLALSPHLDGRQLRSVYHTLKPLQLDGFSSSGDLFTHETRQEYLDQFSDQNAQLRETYFPKEKQLFKLEDPKSDESPPAGLSLVQQNLLTAALKEAFRLHQKVDD